MKPELLNWAKDILYDTLIFKSAYGDTICAACNTRLDFNGMKSEHRPDCKYIQFVAHSAKSEGA